MLTDGWTDEETFANLKLLSGLKNKTNLVFLHQLYMVLGNRGQNVTAGDIRPDDDSVETSTNKAPSKYLITLSFAMRVRKVALQKCH